MLRFQAVNAGFCRCAAEMHGRMSCLVDRRYTACTSCPWHAHLFGAVRLIGCRSAWVPTRVPAMQVEQVSMALAQASSGAGRRSSGGSCLLLHMARPAALLLPAPALPPLVMPWSWSCFIPLCCLSPALCSPTPAPRCCCCWRPWRPPSPASNFHVRASAGLLPLDPPTDMTVHGCNFIAMGGMIEVQQRAAGAPVAAAIACRRRLHAGRGRRLQSKPEESFVAPSAF